MKDEGDLKFDDWEIEMCRRILALRPLGVSFDRAVEIVAAQMAAEHEANRAIKTYHYLEIVRH